MFRISDNFLEYIELYQLMYTLGIHEESWEQREDHQTLSSKFKDREET